MRVSWQPLLVHAAAIVRSYDTGVTLRQLFYRLVADGSLPNTQNYYRSLSSYTAEGRRDGTFPSLLDRISRIEEPLSFTDPASALFWLRDLYRRDRTTGQSHTIMLGVEKAGISAQLNQWFTDPLGIPHVALGGYASQTLADQVRSYISSKGRPSVFIYAGDHDPTGEDIDRDFIQRVGNFTNVHRIALLADQLDLYNIPVNVLDPAVVGKLARDPRAAGFIDRHGYLDQYELDALDPNDLRELYADVIDSYWDEETYNDVIADEDDDIQLLSGRDGGSD
jgi:hypothetical protein